VVIVIKLGYGIGRGRNSAMGPRFILIMPECAGLAVDAQFAKKTALLALFVTIILIET
jgi:hypothetical protein